MSSDEEAEMGIPLCERVQLNRPASALRNKNSSPKQFKGSRKKNHPRSAQWKHFQGCHPKENPNNQWILPETPSPFFLGSKKRQNGDKNEQIAKSKRTCLSDRLLQADLTNNRKKNGIVDLSRSYSDGGLQAVSPPGAQNCVTETSKDEAAECSYSFECRDSGDIFDQNSENSIPLSGTDGPSSSLGSTSSVTNEKQVSFWGLGKQSVTFSDPLSQPSTSKFGQPSVEQENSNTKKAYLNKGVRFLDSDEESRSSVNGVCLKGGRQFPEHVNSVRKVIGRGCRKILDSDDSSDNNWQNQYRGPSQCLSSDTEDSSDFPVKPRRKQFSRYSLSRLSSSDSNDDSVHNPMVPSSHHSRTTTTNKACNSANSHSDSSTFQKTFLGEHSYASPETAERSAASCRPSNGQNQSSHGNAGSPLRSSRFSRHKGAARRSISPHPRMLSTRRHAVMSRLGFGQFGQDMNHRHLASQFPDIFDAEDSSEVEFFTANSYSDAETSDESVGCMEANNSTSRHSGHRNNSTVIVSASSEDEISVIFSGSITRDVHNRRGGRQRGSAFRRRRVRGSVRSSLSNPQEIGSASPDPVEQVRQVEEDERFARMLQAEFDAEANETPMFLNSTESDTDGALMDAYNSSVAAACSRDRSFSPFNTPPSVQANESSEPVPRGPALDPAGLFLPLSHSPVRVRGRPGVGIPSNVSGSRRRRGRRNYQVHHGDPWMWQFARVLGLGPTHHHHHHHHHGQDESDYEIITLQALLHLAETVGEVIPKGLHKAEINRLPTRKYFCPGTGASTSQGCDEVVHKRTELNKECQVCLSDYENGDLLRILPCFHEFHTPCIDPWLKINHTCPVCRVEVSFDN